MRVQPQLMAKAQVVQISGKQLACRIVWRADGVDAIPEGADVVPLPGEAAPDAPPVLTSEVPTFKARKQQPVTLKLPIVDLESGPLRIEWQITGSAGNRGVLFSQSTGTPEVRFLPPTHQKR